MGFRPSPAVIGLLILAPAACASPKPEAPPSPQAQHTDSLGSPPARADPPGRPPLPDDITWPSGTLPVVRSTVNPNYEYHRTVYMVGFTESASGQEVADFLNEYGATIIGGTAHGTEVPLYVIQVPDPGASLAAVEALVERMSKEAGVATVDDGVCDTGGPVPPPPGETVQGAGWYSRSRLVQEKVLPSHSNQSIVIDAKHPDQVTIAWYQSSTLSAADGLGSRRLSVAHGGPCSPR